MLRLYVLKRTQNVASLRIKKDAKCCVPTSYKSLSVIKTKKGLPVKATLSLLKLTQLFFCFDETFYDR